MGVVYRAEQLEPLQREVALKVIKAGMDTEEVVRRFLAEREALARMDHPSIARIFDSGATEQGLPYFVMEFVRGEPLNDYCDRLRLGVPDRLQLFVQVCRAVQHAHTKSIVHRDLKPSNVLVSEVDGRPVPKVIDFGIARAIDRERAELATFTQAGAVIGTPAYMSPEQLDPGADVDTRSDVYSLGVVLYELLTGTLPVGADELRAGAVQDFWRALREQDPPAPSTRVRTGGERTREAARRRGSSTGRLALRLRGDLDWVVMKALEKDRSRRYGTADALARDVERHMADEPVIARPPSRTYLVRKFVARHRGLVATGLLVTVALLLGTAGTTVGFVRASRERALAEQRATEAGAAAARAFAVRDFVTGMLSQADPLRSRKDVTVGEVLEDAVRRLDAGELGGDPDSEYALRVTLGEAFRSVDRYEQAERQLGLATELLPHTTEFDATEPLALKLALAAVLNNRSRFAESGALAEEVLGVLDRRGVGDDDLRVSALVLLSTARYNTASFAEALELQREACEQRERLSGVDSEEAASLRLGEAFLLIREARYDEADELIEQALGALQGDTPTARIHRSYALRQRADVRRNTGRRDEALKDLQEGVRLREELYDEGSVPLSDLLHDLALLQLERYQRDEAEAYARRAVKVRRELLGVHRDTAVALGTLAGTLRTDGRIEEAIELNEEALAMRRELFAPDNPAIADSLWRLGALEREAGELEASERYLRESVAVFSTHYGAEGLEGSLARYELGCTLRSLGRLDEAEVELQAAYDVRVAHEAPTSMRARDVRDQLVEVRLAREDWAGAESLLRAALEEERRFHPGGNLLQTYLGAQLGAALLGRGLAGEAREPLEKAWEVLGPNPAIWAVNKLFLLDQLVQLEEHDGDSEAAERYRALADELRSRSATPR